MAHRAQTADAPVQAKVEWWNASSFYVRCPECDKIHRHGFAGDDDHTARYRRVYRRVSHCGSGNYEIRFPFSEGLDDGGGYEIDKQRALFVAGGADPDEYFREDEDDEVRAFAQDMRNRHKWTEATEMIYVTEEESVKMIDWVVSEMVQGDVECVRRYLESTTESDIFLHGVDVYYPDGVDPPSDDNDADYFGSGKTVVHLAACEMYPRVLELLLQKGADPNATDAEGRVPLTEAALWGRLENVRILLKYGAEKERECVRGGLRRRAIDFARPLRANAEERYVYSGSEAQGYKENTYQRDLDRRAIVRLLEDGDGAESSQDRRSLGGFAFTRSSRDENLLTLVAHFDIPQKWKTIGVLYRGEQFYSVAAMSGWAHREDRDVNIQIAGRDWTAEVRRLCEVIGYDLARHEHDQGEAGRYHACHAEKQLIAYFVNKHLFLCHEIEENEGLANLKSVEPAIPLTKATILACRSICSDCRRFVERINVALGLDITVFRSCLERGCGSCRM